MIVDALYGPQDLKIVENFDNLPEEAQVNVEEDYQVCVRMLGRATVEPKKVQRKSK